MEGYNEVDNDMKAFFALKGLLKTTGGDVMDYKDVRSNKWLEHFGSRRFLIDFHKMNPQRFEKVFKGGDFKNIVESTCSTSKSGIGRGFSLFSSGLSQDDKINLEEIKNIATGKDDNRPSPR